MTINVATTSIFLNIYCDLPCTEFMLYFVVNYAEDGTSPLAACDYSTDTASYCYGISSHISIARNVHIKNNLIIQCPISDSTKTHFQDKYRSVFHI